MDSKGKVHDSKGKTKGLTVNPKHKVHNENGKIIGTFMSTGKSDSSKKSSWSIQVKGNKYVDYTVTGKGDIFEKIGNYLANLVGIKSDSLI